MATTRLISMHKNKGKDCIVDRIDYALNPAKTNDGEYVSSYECDPKTVKGEFLLSKKIYSWIFQSDSAPFPVIQSSISDISKHPFPELVQ